MSQCGRAMMASVDGATYEYETVFELTGNTGSAVYMSPEMHR